MSQFQFKETVYSFSPEDLSHKDLAQIVEGIVEHLNLTVDRYENIDHPGQYQHAVHSKE